jgi:hypothetical protein
LPDFGHEFRNNRAVLNNREHQLVPDMIGVNLFKEERQVVKLLDVARVLTNVVVKVGETLNHSGVVQKGVCTAAKVFV